MNDLRSAAQQALEALKHVWNTTPDDDPVIDEAIANLRAALAEPIQESTCSAPLACSGIDKCVFRYNAQFPPVKTPTIGCDVCGLTGSKVSQVMGYVCPRSDCPTKVTC